MPTLDTIRRAPKVLLHDHLDGGLRPRTVIELAEETGYAGLPTTDEASWPRGSPAARTASRLELYLETFAHTVGVMQTADAIARVARECAEDLAADGIVYAEVRYAPELSTERGLSLDAVAEAWLDGFRDGAERAAAAGHPIVIRALATAMRQADRSLEIAEPRAAVPRRGVVGFDIAGPEAGYPPTPVPTRSIARPARLPPDDPCRRGLRAAVDPRGAASSARSGLATASGSSTTSRSDRTARCELGRLAAYVRDRRIPLELCPTSNVHTGAGAVRRGAPDRPAPPAAVPGDPEHGQPADVAT